MALIVWLLGSLMDKPYMDHKGMRNNGLLGYSWWLLPMILHTFGVHVTTK